MSRQPALHSMESNRGCPPLSAPPLRVSAGGTRLRWNVALSLQVTLSAAGFDPMAMHQHAGQPARQEWHAGEGCMRRGRRARGVLRRVRPAAIYACVGTATVSQQRLPCVDACCGRRLNARGLCAVCCRRAALAQSLSAMGLAPTGEIAVVPFKVGGPRVSLAPHPRVWFCLRGL